MTTDLFSVVRQDLKSRFTLESIVAQAPAMREVMALVVEVARSDAKTILLLGESGSGKSLLARAIHYESPRRERPFVQITCTALQDTLLESELFGHEGGSFTDARARKQGLFEIAEGGTVFLDEISEMSERLQAKLLQVLDDHSFRRVGGLEDLHVNVRVIAATNRELDLLVREGRFRQDLYYRLNVIPIRVPPLRERRQDIPELVDRFISHYNREFRKSVRGASPAAMRILTQHAWPGNVRELKNTVERAVLLANGPVLEPRNLVIGNDMVERRTSFELPPEGIVLARVEQDLISQALDRAAGNITKAARLLGISRDTLRYRIKKYRLARAPLHGVR